MNQPNAQQKGRDFAPSHSQKLQGNHSVTYHQAQSDFIDAMAAGGIAPADPGAIIADGELHRFRIEGDKRGSRNGYFILHMDGIPAGHFGSWKHGVSQSWCAINRDSLTPEQREDNRRRMEASRKAAADLRAQQNRSAADRAAYIWDRAKPAPADFPYLVNKGIQPGIARIKGDVLVLPVTDVEGNMRSLQFIGEEGSKRFLTGGQKKACFIVVNDPDNARRIMICEGFATGATLAEHDTTATVIAALDAGNLEPVALAIRGEHPTADIVIAMDFDEVGRAKGEQAARAIGAKALPPPVNVPEWVTDWNDYAALVQGGEQ
jgi:putative DNA primase/helicase